MVIMIMMILSKKKKIMRYIFEVINIQTKYIDYSYYEIKENKISKF